MTDNLNMTKPVNDNNNSDIIKLFDSIKKQKKRINELEKKLIDLKNIQKTNKKKNWLDDQEENRAKILDKFCDQVLSKFYHCYSKTELGEILNFKLGKYYPDSDSNYYLDFDEAPEEWQNKQLKMVKEQKDVEQELYFFCKKYNLTKEEITQILNYDKSFKDLCYGNNIDLNNEYWNELFYGRNDDFKKF